MIPITNLKHTYSDYVTASEILENFNEPGNKINYSRFELQQDNCNTANTSFHKPINHHNIISMVKASGCIDEYLKLIGMEWLDFIQFKATFSKTSLCQSKWMFKCEFSDGKQRFKDDIAIEDKFDSVAILSVLLKLAYLDANISRSSSDEEITVQLHYDSIETIAHLFGWEVSFKYNFTLLSKIINYALSLSIQNVKVECLLDYFDYSKYQMELSTHMILVLFPSVNLFMLTNNKLTQRDSHCLTSDNKSKFIDLQFKPYVKKYLDKKKNVIPQLSELHLTFPQIVNTPTLNGMHIYTLLTFSDIEKYNADNWHDIVIQHNVKLRYNDTPTHLTMEALVTHSALYERLISIKNANRFLDYIARSHRVAFYDIFQIKSTSNIAIAKKEMFVALAVGHIVEFLLRCGLVLTEEVFSVIFGLDANNFHNQKLLQTGIALQTVIHHGKISVDDANRHIINTKNGNSLSFDNSSQEHRVSTYRTLQLLCTYFKGLEDLIVIKTLQPKIIKSGCFSTDRNIDTVERRWFSTDAQVVEYPLRLVKSCIEALDSSTRESYILQLKLNQLNYIGANNIIFSSDNTPLTIHIKYITADEMTIFRYFTGYSSIEGFTSWVDENFVELSDNKLSDILLLAQKVPYSTYDIIYLILKLSTAIRDFIVMRLILNIDAKKVLKAIMCPKMDDVMFSYIYEYANIMVSFIEHKIRRFSISQDVKKLILYMYCNILPSNAEYSIIGDEYRPLTIDADSKNPFQMSLQKIKSSMQQLSMHSMEGSCLELQSWVNDSTVAFINKEYRLTPITVLTKGYHLCIKGNNQDKPTTRHSFKHKQNDDTHIDTKKRKLPNNVENSMLTNQTQFIEINGICQEDHISFQTYDQDNLQLDIFNTSSHFTEEELYATLLETNVNSQLDTDSDINNSVEFCNDIVELSSL